MVRYCGDTSNWLLLVVAVARKLKNFQDFAIFSILAMKLQTSLVLLALAAALVGAEIYSDPKRVRLLDIGALTLHTGRYTASRRVAAGMDCVMPEMPHIQCPRRPASAAHARAPPKSSSAKTEEMMALMSRFLPFHPLDHFLPIPLQASCP